MNPNDSSGTREAAENEIFNLRKKAEGCLLANDIDGYNGILIAIVALQETYKIYSGVERKPNARTA